MQHLAGELALLVRLLTERVQLRIGRVQLAAVT
jgi:hypothetical protein